MESTDWVDLLRVDNMRSLPGASVADLQACESGLGASLHSAIRDLYHAANGVYDEAAQYDVIWPLHEVVERNRLAWAVEGSRRAQWVGFGDDGTGNPFCLPKAGGEAVFYWSPILQEATYLAANPKIFWQAWLADNLPAH